MYTIQIQRALGPATASDTALFFGHLGLATALCLAPPLVGLHLAGWMDTGRVTPAALGLACFNGGRRALGWGVEARVDFGRLLT